MGGKYCYNGRIILAVYYTKDYSPHWIYIKYRLVLFIIKSILYISAYVQFQSIIGMAREDGRAIIIIIIIKHLCTHNQVYIHTVLPGILHSISFETSKLCIII